MSKIEWTDVTWNPLAGCSVISPGCKRCYAMKMAARLERMGMAKYAGLTMQTNAGAVWTGEVRLDESALLLPLRWKKPRRILVNSMSDLFHESVPDEWIDRIFAVMALAPQHTFQVLTKRAGRMREYLAKFSWERAVKNCRGSDGVSIITRHSVDALNRIFGLSPQFPGHRVAKAWPLPNVWLGVSVEDQQRADERIPELLATPAAVRFLSCEPLLGPIDIGNWLWLFKPCGDCPCPDPEASREGFEKCCREPELQPSPIHWVIAGGESGQGARPAHPDWFRSLRDQCAAADVPFFFKQWGEHIPIYDSEGERGQLTFDAADGGPEGRFEGIRAKVKWFGKDAGPNEDGMARVGKKLAGRLLDGVEHNGLPKVLA